MKSLKLIVIMLVALATITSCDYGFSLDLENQYSEGIYIWSQKTGLETGNDPQSIDPKSYLNSGAFFMRTAPNIL